MSQIKVTEAEVDAFINRVLGGKARLLNTNDVAEFEGCHPQNVRRLRSKGKMPGWRRFEGVGLRITVADYLRTLKMRDTQASV